MSLEFKFIGPAFPAMDARLARIAKAKWQNYAGSHALVAADDSEVLALLNERIPGIFVVDETDKSYVGLDNAKEAAVRDLRAAAWSTQ
jgi:hypothetical protein